MLHDNLQLGGSPSALWLQTHDDDLTFAAANIASSPSEHSAIDLDPENLEIRCVDDNDEVTCDSETIDTISISSDDSSGTDKDTDADIESTRSQIVLENGCEHVRSLFYFFALQRTVESIESTSRSSIAASVKYPSSSLPFAEPAFISGLNRDNGPVTLSVHPSDASGKKEHTANTSTKVPIGLCQFTQLRYLFMNRR
ncbi:uncharacterized protein BDZ99DRAFT_470997 [Mytilinidion resinicola]|uniref:Uncharacterized protein n=1 Tax=Mytilinidion resinicola TaxID=574789 RepID=A0A6A6Z3D1_9PEZI|nr:uncharacterized protein BDZ99DRAFT_470997 [Mytilinidion resinicola]KAF2815641.1 hypothetical protein BDZ99DRAFT_470997 [Mytilinidion resinicola]